MARFSLWSPRKNNDYNFIDNTINEMFRMAATSIFVHKFLGIGDGDDPSIIEDPLFLENRDRHYDPHVYELLGTHNVQDMEFSLTQFGMIMEADVLFFTFHMNDSVRKLGRKIMAGDVFEIPHLRDDLLLREDSPAINKYYVVEDVTRAAEGFSPTWYPHLFRVKVKPMTNSEEYDGIIKLPIEDANGDPITNENGEDISLGDILSDYQQKIELNKRVVEEAEKAVDRRNFETQQFYVVPGDEMGKQYPWIFAGDGIPPDGAQLAGRGKAFPENPVEGEWYLRIDYDPYVLFQRQGHVWRRMEVDLRRKWQAAHRILESFINNNKTTTIQDESFPEKQPLSKAITPRADF